MWLRALKTTLAILLPVFFLFLFFRSIDRHEFVRAVASVTVGGWLLLVLAALVQLLHLALRAARWRILLNPMKKGIGYYNLSSTICIGYMVTMLLPGRIGEVLRPVMLAARERITKSGSLATVILERLMDGLAVASLLAIYLVFFWDSGTEGAGASDGIGGRGAVIFGGLILVSFPMLWALVHFRKQAARLLGRLIREDGKLGKTVHGIFHGVVDGFEVLKGGRALLAAWTYTFLIWIIISFSIWFSLLAFNIRIPMAGSLLMLAALTIGIAIPTQGGVGTYEWFGQEALVRFFGIEASTAGAAVLVLHVFAITPVILLGLWFVWREGLSFSGLKAEVRGVEGAGVAPEAGPAGEGRP